MAAAAAAAAVAAAAAAAAIEFTDEMFTLGQSATPDERKMVETVSRSDHSVRHVLVITLSSSRPRPSGRRHLVCY